MIYDLLEDVCVIKIGEKVELDIDTDSLMEVESLAQQVLED